MPRLAHRAIVAALPAVPRRAVEPFARTYLTATAPGADLHWLAERHVAILDAFTDRDPERAAEVMRAHAREAERQVLDPDAADGPDATA